MGRLWRRAIAFLFDGQARFLVPTWRRRGRRLPGRRGEPAHSSAKRYVTKPAPHMALPASGGAVSDALPHQPRSFPVPLAVPAHADRLSPDAVRRGLSIGEAVRVRRLQALEQLLRGPPRLGVEPFAEQRRYLHKGIGPPAPAWGLRFRLAGRAYFTVLPCRAQPGEELLQCRAALKAGLLHSRCKVRGRAVPNALHMIDKLAAAGQFHSAPQQTSLEARFASYLSSLTGPGREWKKAGGQAAA